MAESLGKGNDSSETDVVRGFERDSPSTAEKSLRSWIELTELYPTTSADLKTDIVVNVQVRKSADFFVIREQARGDGRKY